MSVAGRLESMREYAAKKKLNKASKLMAEVYGLLRNDWIHLGDDRAPNPFIEQSDKAGEIAKKISELLFSFPPLVFREK